MVHGDAGAEAPSFSYEDIQRRRGPMLNFVAGGGGATGGGSGGFSGDDGGVNGVCGKRLTVAAPISSRAPLYVDALGSKCCGEVARACSVPEVLETVEEDWGEVHAEAGASSLRGASSRVMQQQHAENDHGSASRSDGASDGALQGSGATRMVVPGKGWSGIGEQRTMQRSTDKRARYAVVGALTPQTSQKKHASRTTVTRGPLDAFFTRG